MNSPETGRPGPTGPGRTTPVAAPTDSVAAVPEVTVATRSLSGFWKMTGPAFIEVSIGLTTGARIEYSAETGDRNICQVDDRAGRLSGICSAGIDRAAVGDRDGDQVVLHWWNGPITMIFEGRLDGPDRIRGRLSGGVVGLSVTGAVPMTLARIDAAGITPEPDSAAVMRAVLADLGTGKLTPGRYGPEALDAAGDALARHRGESAAPSLAWLGRIHIRWQRGQPEKIQDVYRVARGDDQEMCRLGLGEGGTVAALECRGIRR